MRRPTMSELWHLYTVGRITDRDQLAERVGISTESLERTLQRGIARGDDYAVRLTAGTSRWTGV